MPIAAQCPHCGENMQVREKYAGKKGMCPKCQRPFRVPESSDQRAAEPSEARTVASRTLTGRTGGPTAPKEGVIEVDASAAHLVAVVPTNPGELREAILGGFDSRITPPQVPLGRKLFTQIVLGVLL
ncbi:MAG TPA: hypothetical protein VFB80_11740, partial [Pirellulaceae bacterium]|nr:hypothetical protein [Pirellulaceae bacterium]